MINHAPMNPVLRTFAAVCGVASLLATGAACSNSSASPANDDGNHMPGGDGGAGPAHQNDGGTNGGGNPVHQNDGGTSATNGDDGGATTSVGGATVDCTKPVDGDQALWLAYKQMNSVHPNLPNNSFAGFAYGETALPNYDHSVIDVTAAPYNAKGDGTADDTVAIRAALAAVQASGGVVYLPAGTYKLSGPLFVHTDNTVVRGAGRDQTKLVFSQSLQDSYARNVLASGKSSWSWSGGLVWFTPKSKNTYLGAGGKIANWNEDWNVGDVLTKVSAAARGDQKLTADDVSGLAVGQYVFVQVDNPADLSALKYLTGGGQWADSYDWSRGNSGQVLDAQIIWPVEIAKINGHEITLRQPLRFDLKANWNPRLRKMGDVIRGSGIEHLSISLQRKDSWTFAANHLMEPGWNGPWFNNAIDGFCRDVAVINADMGFGTSAAKNITFQDIVLDASTPSLLSHHHATTTRNYSNDILFERFQIKSQPWHGLNVENFSMGNVWSKGTMLHGTFDTHRALPYEALRTDIVVYNDGKRGGASDAGPIMGARFVIWNVQVMNGVKDMIGDANIMPSGAIVGVRGCDIGMPGNSACAVDLSGQTGQAPSPANLYEAELYHRMCEQH